MKNYQITQWCAAFIRQQVQEGDFCIDATMGNGNDTLLLSQLCGKSGKVLAFDIQEQALTATQKRLNAGHVPENYRLLLESHANMAEYATPDSVSCIVFNFGYLPGGDHSLATRGETSIQALTQALTLLKKGGMISLCIYSGGDSGFEERDQILDWLKNLDPHQYLVIKSEYYNRPNNPPIPVLIIKINCICSKKQQKRFFISLLLLLVMPFLQFLFVLRALILRFLFYLIYNGNLLNNRLLI